MTDPIRFDSKIILAKPEGTYATDPTPTGAANAMLMKNVEIRPMEGQDVSRNLERPYMGAQEEMATALYSVLTGTVELVGSGDTGVAPAWGPLMRACGVAEVVTPDDTPGDGTVEYTPVTDAHESVALHFYIGTTRHVILGTRGTVEVTFNAQGLPEGRFTLTGLFFAPSNQVRPSVDLTAFQVPEVVTDATVTAFTIDSVSFVMSTFGFNLGNSVEPRLWVGREAIIITGRQEALTARVEAVPLGTWNPFSKTISRARVPVVLEHGSTAGARFKFEAPTCSVKRLSGYESSQNILEWPLALTPLPDEGNDQWKITLS